MLARQCESAGIPCLVKQAEAANGKIVSMPVILGKVWNQYPEPKDKMMNEYTIRFETDLNESMRVVIYAKTEKSAIKKLKADYPSAFKIDVG